MTKILIVDDEPMMLMVTKKILSQKYEILCANSAKEALGIYDAEHPDMILTDLLMPEMTGFEMHQALQEKYTEKIPVMYMTADDADETEGKGFDLGAVDFIRKPFRADVLLRRVDNILQNREIIKDLQEEATTDQLTGLLNKAGAISAFTEACQKRDGYFLMIDLDSFKLVNDLYGHDFGDDILTCFARLLRENLSREEDLSGRIGGDEFMGFLSGPRDEARVERLARILNEKFLEQAKEILGPDMNIPLGTSIGAVAVPEFGRDYEELFKMADQTLYGVKQNGKHGYAVYRQTGDTASEETPEEDLKRLSLVLSERNVANSALWLGQDAFANVYRFLVRLTSRYNMVAHKILFTLRPVDGSITTAEFEEIVKAFGENLHMHLRKSDLMMQSRNNQFFLLLPELDHAYVEQVVERILNTFNVTGYAGKARVVYQAAYLSEEI